ncbi:MAG: VWA domain-containing protein, partial [Bacteroidota bacterium]
MLENIQFIHPWFFLLLVLIPMAIVYQLFFNRKGRITLKMPDLRAFDGQTSWRGRLRMVLPVFRILAFAALVTALARPQSTLKEEDIKAKGVDINLVIDLSSSMLSRDFKPDRLEVSKRVASEFVSKRAYDRIGLTVFAGEAFSQCPLTTDHRVVQEFLANLKCGLLEDGTAIGMGLGTAVNRLKDTEAKSKIVILLTDGVNNAGYIKPITAAQIAQEFDIKVYTIGVGTKGQALAPVSRRANGTFIFDMAPVEIDEGLLTEISNMTGGKYFRATTAEGLQRIYDEIDRLEKTEIEVTTVRRYSEEF